MHPEDSNSHDLSESSKETSSPRNLPKGDLEHGSLSTSRSPPTARAETLRSTRNEDHSPPRQWHSRSENGGGSKSRLGQGSPPRHGFISTYYAERPKAVPEPTRKESPPREFVQRGNKRAIIVGEEPNPWRPPVSMSERDHRRINPFPYSLAEIRYQFLEKKQCRSFVARCDYYDIFAKAKRSNIYRTPEYIAKRLRATLEGVDNVILFFTVHKTDYFQGIISSLHNIL